MKFENPNRCCQEFLDKHGQPEPFVTRLFTCPASSLDAFEDEQTELNLQLMANGACEHIASAARVIHILVCGNARYNEESLARTQVAADFLGIDHEDAKTVLHDLP